MLIACLPCPAVLVPPNYTLTEHFCLSPTALGATGAYIMRMFRLRAQGAPPHGPPVLLQHALLDSSTGWLLLGPNRGLAFVLANAGELALVS